LNEIKYLKSKTVYATIAVIFVTAALVTLPYQNQVANAQPSNRYQIRVTLTGVPDNAEDLEMNASIIRGPFIVVSDPQIKTVSSPENGDTVRFSFRVPAGSNEDSVFICGTRTPSLIMTVSVTRYPAQEAVLLEWISRIHRESGGDLNPTHFAIFIILLV
jgi:hypothetical protein